MNQKHYEKSILIPASANEIFAYADNHQNFSSHMTQSSMMMGGGKMKIETDSGKGQEVGSHIKMSGKVLGINLYLDEVISVHKPPHQKEWKTVGSINLIVIDHYILGFEIIPNDKNSLFRTYIYYELPKSIKTKPFGLLFGKIYARWCVEQMIASVAGKFGYVSK